MRRLISTLSLLCVCLALLALADSVAGHDAAEALELLHSQEDSDLGSNVGIESIRSDFLAVFRPRTGGLAVKFHRASPWAHASTVPKSAVQKSMKNMMDELMSGSFQALDAPEAHQQQVMSSIMQRQVVLAAAAAAADPSDQALAYAAMLPRRPCPRHQASMMAASRMEDEEGAAAVQNALMSALATSYASSAAQVMDMHTISSQLETHPEEGSEWQMVEVDGLVTPEGPGAGSSPNGDLGSDYEEADGKSSEYYSEDYSYGDPFASDVEPVDVSEDDGVPTDFYDEPSTWWYIWHDWAYTIENSQLLYMCLGFAFLLLLLVQTVRAQQLQQRTPAAVKDAELYQPLLYMSPAEVLAAVEKLPGAALVVEAPSGAAMRWENPVYYERLQGKE